MNRRSLLALLGGAAAAPVMGAKAAASGLGLDAATISGASAHELVAGIAGPSNGWWGSPLQAAFDAKERASYRLDRGDGFPHMKSWGRAFRLSQVEREEVLLSLYRRKMESDAAFFEKAMASIGLKS